MKPSFLIAAAFALLATHASAEPVKLLCTGTTEWMKKGKVEITDQSVKFVTVDLARGTIIEGDGGFAQFNSSNLGPSIYTGEDLAFSANDDLFHHNGRLDRATGHLTDTMSDWKKYDAWQKQYVPNTKTTDQFFTELKAMAITYFNGYCRRLERVLP